MSQIFHRSTNTIARVSIFGAVFFVAGLLGLFAAVNRSPWVTDARVAREQPIQFSHEHHVAGNGIDCRYCHTSVEDSRVRRHPADQDLHELPLADLVATARSSSRCATSFRTGQLARSGRASTTCPTSSTSTTAST